HPNRETEIKSPAVGPKPRQHAEAIEKNDDEQTQVAYSVGDVEGAGCNSRKSQSLCEGQFRFSGNCRCTFHDVALVIDCGCLRSVAHGCFVGPFQAMLSALALTVANSETS